MLVLVDPVLAESVRAADELTSYAVDARYPSELPEPSEAEARRALALAESVHAVAERSLTDDLR